MCPAWPTEQPRPPQGTPGPLFSTPPAIPLRQVLPLPCAACRPPGQYLMCCRHGNLHVPSRFRLREVGGVGNPVRGPVAWNQRSLLYAGACWLSWGLGSGALSPRNLTLLRDMGQSCLTLGGLAKGHCPRPLPVNWAQWISPGLNFREMWIQILHPHLLLRSPGTTT